ncbi:MAG: GTPase HflX, partial [Planctomycetota bacterium]
MDTKKAILVGPFLPHERKQTWYSSPLEELDSLAKTAGIEVVGEFIQNLSDINPAYYLGKGKVLELARLVSEQRVDLVLFDNDLSPSQVKNLEKLLKVPILDRTELILYIFASHAKTKEAKLQVELAQMEYTLPRLQKMWTHLSRIDGKLGAKGPGEKQIEMDRRLVRKKIIQLKRVLENIQKRKVREVQKRHKVFKVALVGYTNAGKSTLMNALTQAGVLVEDKLFATLDTRTRVWNLAEGKKVLLSDTVGFISKIPPHLIASFHATLEEVTQADLLLHVVDLSHWAPMEGIQEVNKVLQSLGCENKPVIMVFNKVDLLTDPIELNLLKEKYSHHVVISAKKQEG